MLQQQHIILEQLRTNLQRPSFWLSAIIVPIILAALYAWPLLTLSGKSHPINIVIVDESDIFANTIDDTANITFSYATSLDQAWLQAGKTGLVLLIPQRHTTIPRDAFLYYRQSIPSPDTERLLGVLLQQKLQQNIPFDNRHTETASSPRPSVHIAVHSRHMDPNNTDMEHFQRAVALASAILMLLTLVVFAMSTCRLLTDGRISTRPFQAIISLTLVGIVLILLWALIFAAMIAWLQHTAPWLASLRPLQLPLVATIFALFFVLGYALYGTCLAKNTPHAECTRQQYLRVAAMFLLPSLALAASPAIIHAPSAGLAVVLSLLPFTAPIAIMLRLPYGIPTWQAWLSAALILATVIFTAVIAHSRDNRHRKS